MFFWGGDHKSLRHSPACAAGLKGFQLCSNVGGHYRTPTQRMHQLFYGKSLKITIKLHCLILPQMGNLMTPVQFWGCLSFSKKLPARASILKKKNNNNNHYIQGSSLVCSTTEAQGFRFNSRGKALRPCCRIACITLRGRDVALVFLWPVFVGEKGKGLVLSCGYTFRYTTYVLVHELLFIICLGCLFFGICLGGT